MFKNILIVANPRAGHGTSEKYAKKIEKVLIQQQMSPYIFLSQSIEHTQEFFKTLADEKKIFDCVVIIGGDGTLGPVVDAMLRVDLNFPIYAFGRGTANDFSRYFKTMVNIKKFAAIIAGGRTTQANVIEVNGQYAVSVACGGAFTNGVTHYNKRSKKLFGKAAYFGKALAVSLTMKAHPVRFEVDGIEFKENIYTFIIANTKYAGGLKYVSPLADHNDDILDLIALKRCSFIGRVSIFFSFICRLIHKDKNVVYKRGKHFKVMPAEPVIYNFSISDIDGNAGTQYPLDVKVSNKKIYVVVK